MDRRSFLQGINATALLGGILAIPGLASEAEAAEQPLEERLERLERHIHLLRGRPPAPIVERGLHVAKLPPTLLQDLLVGLLVAQTFKSATEAEQQDPRWEPFLKESAPRYAVALAHLLEFTQSRTDSRSLRRLKRRPNKVARITQLAIAGKTTPERNEELRQALGAVAASNDVDPYQDMSAAFDEALAFGEEEGLAPYTRQRFLKRTLDPDNDPRRELKVGLLLMLGGPLVFTLGFATTLVVAGFPEVIGIPLLILTLSLCVVGVLMFIFGIVLVISAAVHAIQQRPRGAADLLPEPLAPEDQLLLEEIDLLLAA